MIMLHFRENLLLHLKYPGSHRCVINSTFHTSVIIKVSAENNHLENHTIIRILSISPIRALHTVVTRATCGGLNLKFPQSCYPHFMGSTVSGSADLAHFHDPCAMCQANITPVFTQTSASATPQTSTAGPIIV